jgi:hypothetical protein
MLDWLLRTQAVEVPNLVLALVAAGFACQLLSHLLNGLSWLLRLAIRHLS